MKFEGPFLSVSHIALQHNFAALPTSLIMRNCSELIRNEQITGFGERVYVLSWTLYKV